MGPRLIEYSLCVIRRLLTGALVWGHRPYDMDDIIGSSAEFRAIDYLDSDLDVRNEIVFWGIYGIRIRIS